jgi:hypothetical protein
MYFRLRDTNATLPYFITNNYTNGSFSGIASDTDIGTYQLECVGIDDANWETILLLTLRIKRNLNIITSISMLL